MNVDHYLVLQQMTAFGFCEGLHVCGIENKKDRPVEMAA
jgi:hypothetical protein